jgi:Anti-sigma-K factor rskA
MQRASGEAMTTGEHPKTRAEAELPTAEALGPVQAAACQRGLVTERWYRRTAFWRAVAGMGLAFALGCAAIALEITAELSHRSAIYRLHIESMGSRIAQLRKDLAEVRRQNAAMSAVKLANAEVNRILSAPDAALLRWPSNSSVNGHGLVAASRKAGGALIEVAGLSAAPGGSIVVWWLVHRGGAIKAAALNPSPDGRESLFIKMPERNTRLAGVMITLENKKSLDKPEGRVILKGVLSKPRH